MSRLRLLGVLVTTVLSFAPKIEGDVIIVPGILQNAEGNWGNDLGADVLKLGPYIILGDSFRTLGAEPAVLSASE